LRHFNIVIFVVFNYIIHLIWILYLFKLSKYKLLIKLIDDELDINS